MTSSFLRSGRYWLVLLAVAMLLLVVFETVLLALSTGYFSGGYQAKAAAGPGSIALYLLGASLLDAVLVVASWLICLPVLSHFRGGPFRCASIALLIGAAPAALTALARHQIHVLLGELVRTSLLGSGPTGDSTSALAAIDAFAPPSHVSVLIACGLLGAMLPLVGRALDLQLDLGWVARPDRRRLLQIGGVAVLLATGLVVYSIRHDPPLYHALTRKASGQVFSMTADKLTDWDLDGFGLLSRPMDPAVFDASIHPYAVDIAGNGIDENGIGGDHPRDALAPGSLPPVSAPPPTAAAAAKRRPHVLLIFLETFRAELLDAELDGKPITPFLSELARTGARSERMFVHSPWTLASRDQLFLGSIGGDPARGTLQDDFAARGYATAHFSGQDDSYGDSAERLGFVRADHFYDARVDIDRRTTRSTASVSLQVSWKTVLERVDAYLDAYDADRPLFLYVNIVDTHFPFTHSEIDEIIADPALGRSEIRAEHAERIFRAYANTAANVDRAVERLVTHWQETFEGEDRALLVTADHGESFYEHGTLGHGQTVAAVETRVPLIVHGIGGEWPEPIAISDLRGLVAANLGVETGDVRPVFRVDPDRTLFQYLGSLEAPERIALRRWNGTHVFDVLRDEGWRLDAGESRLDEAPAETAIREVIWTWEDLQPRG